VADTPVEIELWLDSKLWRVSRTTRPTASSAVIEKRGDNAST
jgi:hypothetical protein